jgi:hypothetical protein
MFFEKERMRYNAIHSTDTHPTSAATRTVHYESNVFGGWIMMLLIFSIYRGCVTLVSRLWCYLFLFSVSH